RAVPASAQSISTNGANQDVVSMGTIAARQTATHLGHLSEIMAILALSVAQGISLAAAEAAAFSPTARALLSLVRKTSPALDEDRPLSAEITALARVLLDDQAAQDGILTASSPRADPLRKGE
ncbi:MAG: aromatic amino acid lyase, partial [Pseudomonadota bacterium]